MFSLINKEQNKMRFLIHNKTVWKFIKNEPGKYIISSTFINFYCVKKVI